LIQKTLKVNPKIETLNLHLQVTERVKRNPKNEIVKFMELGLEANLSDEKLLQNLNEQRRRALLKRNEMKRIEREEKC
jgi:hypothetical protein